MSPDIFDRLSQPGGDIFDRIEDPARNTLNRTQETQGDIFDRIGQSSGNVEENPSGGDIFDRVAPTLGKPTPIMEEIGKGFGMGVASSTRSFGGSLEWLANKAPEGADKHLWSKAVKLAGQQITNLGKSREEFYKIEDPSFLYKVAAGFGSLGTFLIPGLGAAKLSQAVAVAPRLAQALSASRVITAAQAAKVAASAPAVTQGVGASASGILESMVEAGSTYQRALEKGMDESGANAAANATFVLNLPTTILLNRLGVFGDKAKINEVAKGIRGALKRVAQTGKPIAMSGLSEGTQEGLQGLIGNVSVSDDPMEGVFESMIIGAITGTGFKSLETLSDRITPEKPRMTDTTRTVDPTQPEIVQAPPPSPEILAEVAKSEPTFNVEPGVPDAVQPPGQVDDIISESQLSQPQDPRTQEFQGMDIDKALNLSKTFSDNALGSMFNVLNSSLINNKPENAARAKAMMERKVKNVLQSQGATLDGIFLPGTEFDASRDGSGYVLFKGRGDGTVGLSLSQFSSENVKAKIDAFEAAGGGTRPVGGLAGVQARIDAMNKKIANIKKPQEEVAEPGIEENAMAGGMWTNQIDIQPATQPIEGVVPQPMPFPQIYQLAKSLIGENITAKNMGALGMFRSKEGVDYGKIVLRPDLFQRGNEQQLAKTLAHEIGHLIDWLPEHSLKRGNLLGRLMVMRDFMKENYGELNNEIFKRELMAVSQYLHPFDREKSPLRYIKYRDSSRELYAEAISLLLNSPGKMQELAPKSMELFYKNLDKKPKVKQEYFALLEILNGTPEKVAVENQKNTRAMFVKGEELRAQKEAERELASVSTWERLRKMFDDKYRPIIQKRQSAEAKGRILPPENSPEYQFEELAWSDNDNFLMIADIDNNALNPLKKAGLDELDLAEYLFLNRILGDPNMPTFAQLKQSAAYQMADDMARQELEDTLKRMSDRMDIANPLGIQPMTAQQQLENLRNQLGNEKFAVLESSARAFHDIVFRSVTEAVKVGSYSQWMYDNVLLPNKDRYVAFNVLEYLQTHVPAGIKPQKGTLKEIESPVVSTILKMVSLNNLNARQRALNQMRDWLKKDFPADVSPAKKDRSGNFIDPGRESKRGLIKVLEDGKMAAYEVDAYLAESVNKSTPQEVQTIARFMNSWLANPTFKNLYITYNIGFSISNVQRDFKRTYRNLQPFVEGGVTIRELLMGYLNHLPDAIKFQKGEYTSLVREMMENKAMGTTFVDFNFNIQEDEYHATLRKLGIIKGENTDAKTINQRLARPLIKILEGIRFVGSTLEVLPKIASYNILKNTGQYSNQRLGYITRNYPGTPNYRRGGTMTSVSNAFYMFSNIWKEGTKTDAQLATRPETAAAWWWAAFKTDLFPKFLMFALASGLLGEEWKKKFAKVSEYDKTNYLVVPLGEDQDGKIVYMRFAHDETTRLLSGLFWKLANGMQKGEVEKMAQAFSFGAGQVPGLAPGIEIASNWVQFLQGKNPYDDFRGRYLISDTAWKAGGWPALKKMVQWTINQSGQIQISTYDDANKTTFEAVLEATPGLNRIIKRTDFGLTEAMREDRSAIEKRQAQLTLKKRELINKGVDRIEKGERPMAVAQEISKKLYDKPTGEQIRNIRKSLDQKELREQNTYLDMLVSARTNEEKILILRRMRERFSDAEMRQFERDIIRSKTATSSVVMQSRRAK